MAKDKNESRKESKESQGKPASAKPACAGRATAGKSEVALREERILEFWKKNNIFEKSLEKPSPKGEFVFYDGPPFATGEPHYGHILPTTMKDVIPRYKTMKGYHVERIWGWDCHGLPVENLVEKELGLKTKKDIEEYGIDKFNEKAEESVLRYADVWKEVIPRVGRWVDMERDYKTMDFKYTESIWWAFKTLFDKGLAYEGYKSMHICPRCETTLSNFEVTQGYKDITDISVTVEFELIDEIGTYLLAWTTTPWTLPGNVALAVKGDALYVKAEVPVMNQPEGVPKKFILAKDRLEGIPYEYTILEEFKGHELVGKSYRPLFDYYARDHDLENWENGWKIYDAPFVTMEEGTGIVHIAPAFGEDDMNLGREKNLPFVQHVATDGRFKEEVTDFTGMLVKPKDDPKKTDAEIVENIAHRGILFSKEKITHSYPHCWRCETPLLNYTATSWFIKVTGIIDNLLANNRKTKWVPAHLREGRFGKWLEGARDWAISRSRYWGAPLPVWKCEACEKQSVIGGIKGLQDHLPKSNNRYIVMRHGQAESNAKEINSTKLEHNNPLTEKGRTQARATSQELKSQGIELIISSPFQRAKETTEIIAQELGISEDQIVSDERIGEINLGEFHLKSIRDYRAHFSPDPQERNLERMSKRPPGGEHLYDVRKRVMDFLYDIDSRYSGKNILIVTHEYPIWMLVAGSRGLNKVDSSRIKASNEDFVETSRAKELPFVPLPHDECYELDLHRPYIDEITFPCECGGEMKRIPEVFDCWFESGSMPYASLHYPFENKKRFHKRFPADFIAEGLDQTRGWFYSLMVLSTALFNQPTFKNVVVNGIIMGEDGQKMSKRLGNYPEPGLILDKYGADALRLFLMMSPAVRAEEGNLSEKGIHEILNKIMNRLWNVVSFYELYAGDLKTKDHGLTISTNVLDIWIIARLNETIEGIEKGLDNYEFDKASRPIGDFVDDLSTWYLRRSRERFKAKSNPSDSIARSSRAGFRGENEADKQAALSVTQFVLLEFSKAIAPIIPFIAESVFQKVRGDDCKANPAKRDARSSEAGFRESVHLEKWPSIPKTFWGKPKINIKIINDMKQVRGIVEKALAARQEAGIRTRQPLRELKVKSLKLKDEYIKLIKDEVNVKGVVFDSSIENEVELDTEITPELKREGDFRELLRAVQDLRKKENLTPSDFISLVIETSDKGKDLIAKFEDSFKKTVLAKEVKFSPVLDGYEIKIDSLSFKIKINK